MERKCKAKNHNMCRDSMCLVYLVGKRESRVFPGLQIAQDKEQIKIEQEWTTCRQDV